MAGERWKSSGGMVTVDASELELIAHSLAATEDEVKLALKRALNRTVMWMQTRAKRALAAGLNIPSKVIRSRLRYAMYSASTKRARVWFGLNPVSLARLSPRKNKRGVRASGEQYDHAFMATGRNGNKHVWRRTTKERFPVVSVYKDIDQGADILESEVFEGWDKFFYQRFEHELNWQRSR